MGNRETTGQREVIIEGRRMNRGCIIQVLAAEVLWRNRHFEEADLPRKRKLRGSGSHEKADVMRKQMPGGSRGSEGVDLKEHTLWDWKPEGQKLRGQEAEAMGADTEREWAPARWRQNLPKGKNKNEVETIHIQKLRSSRNYEMIQQDREAEMEERGKPAWFGRGQSPQPKLLGPRASLLGQLCSWNYWWEIVPSRSLRCTPHTPTPILQNWNYLS